MLFSLSSERHLVTTSPGETTFGTHMLGETTFGMASPGEATWDATNPWETSFGTSSPSETTTDTSSLGETTNGLSDTTFGAISCLHYALPYLPERFRRIRDIRNDDDRLGQSTSNKVKIT